MVMPSEHKPTLATSNGATPDPARPIVVVDDELNILELIQEILEEEGFSVLTARNGAAALRLLECTPAVLVLTDLMMPHVDGIELARRLRANPKTAEIPIILMSAALPADIGDMFVEVIQKPFPITTIVEVVRACLPL
jgi:CheY-like chemotaxis protein